MDFNPEIVYSLLCKDLPIDHTFLTSDLTVREARMLSLKNSLLKKWIPEDNSSLEKVAITSFHTSNNHCANVSFDKTSYYWDTLLMAQSLMHGYLSVGFETGPAFSLDEIVKHGRAGPGSSVGTKHTDFYRKMFCGKLTTTEEALYKHYRYSLNERWHNAELLRERQYGHQIVRGNELLTVPKNGETNRTIAKEPSLNMFYQLGAGALLEQLLKKYHNIDLSIQPDRNKAYAKVGSLTGSFATIDLKDASNTISTALVKFLVPRQAYSTLDFIRAKNSTYNGDEIPLEMFSSMGNGFTFPLQTLIFATLVRAYYIMNGISCSKDNIPQYSAFGDDIICTKKAYDGVTEFLEYCGFLVNKTKSFNHGPFRESCGADFFKGHDIRGIYLKECKNDSQAYSIFNRLARWSVRWSISIARTLAYIRCCAKFRPVPLHAGDSEGFKWPSRDLNNIRRDKNGSAIYSAVVVVSKVCSVSDSDVNYDGAVISAIGGYIREHKIATRSFAPILKVVKRKTPNWDYSPDPGFTARDLSLLVAIISY